MKLTIKYFFILMIITLFTGCIENEPELKSFYKMGCDELMSKQAQIKEDLGSNSVGVILEAIFDDNNRGNEFQREENSLKRDLRDVQRAIYDRKCEWNNIQ